MFHLDSIASIDSKSGIKGMNEFHKIQKPCVLLACTLRSAVLIKRSQCDLAVVNAVSIGMEFTAVAIAVSLVASLVTEQIWQACTGDCPHIDRAWIKLKQVKCSDAVHPKVRSVGRDQHSISHDSWTACTDI